NGVMRRCPGASAGRTGRTRDHDARGGGEERYQRGVDSRHRARYEPKHCGRFLTAGDYDTSRLAARRLSRGVVRLKGRWLRHQRAESSAKRTMATVARLQQPLKRKTTIRKKRFRLAIRGAK